MSKNLKHAILGLVWPGPIAGPLPINLFRILTPILVLFFRPIGAALLMGVISSFLSVFYFRLIEIDPEGSLAKELLNKLPGWAEKRIETSGPVLLFILSVLLGVFTYAISLKFLKYREATSEILLVVSSFVNAFIWAGIFWGLIVESLRYLATFAF